MTSFKTHDRPTRSALPAALAILLMLSGTGCASLTTLVNFRGDKAADAAHPPIEVLAIWQAAEGPGPGGIPTRGFAGQIYFSNQDSSAPIVVDGKARIYVFDDHGTVQEQARPLHQFDFDRESWKAHLQTSKLGPTYGVFIPYTRNDYHQAVCSLRIRFTPVKGATIYSQSSTIALPGPPLKAEAAPPAPPSPLDGLAKKLQQQSQPPRAWQNPVIDTEPKPFNNDPRLAAAQFPMPAAAPSPQSPGRFNPILQTAATTAGAPDETMGSIENAVVPPAPPQQEAFQPSARIKLQSANADSSGDAGIGTFGDVPPTADAGPPPSRRSHPLDD